MRACTHFDQYLFCTSSVQDLLFNKQQLKFLILLIEVYKKIMKRKVRVKALEGTPFLISEQEEIGKGSFGRVVRAYKKDQPFRQLVAKIIQVIPENKDSIVAQIKILKQIPHHQNLVNCQKLQIVTQNNFYLIMEYCNGGSFQNYIKNNHNCSEEIIWRFFKEFAKGYHVLYDCHLIHRDIKPQNILIHNGKFKIADFGLSRKVNHHNLTQNLSVKGTPLYIAPQLQQQSAGSSKIDVFSLGIVMYRLAFNGKHPFHNQQNNYLSLQQYFADVMATPIKIPKFPKRSLQLTDLIEQMLEKDPIKRIGWKQIFEHPKLKQKAEVVNSESNQQFSQLMKSIIEINRSSASLQVIAEPFNHRDQMGAQIERLVEFTEYLPHFQIRGLEIFIIRSKVIIQLIKHLNGNLKTIKEQKKMKKIGIIEQIINEGLIFIQNSLGKLIQIVSKYQTQVQNSSTSKLIQTLQSQRQNMRQMIQKLKINQKYEHLKYENLLYDYLTEYTEWKSNMKQKFKIPTALMIDLYDGLLKLQSMVIFNANGRIEVVQIQLQDAELDKINYQNLGTYQLYLDQINQITMDKVEKRLKSMGLMIL